MKRVTGLLLFACFAFSGCSATSNLGSLNSTQTSVDLSRGNFKVIRTVRSSITGTIFFGLGDTQSLFTRAHAQLISDAELEGKPRALINQGVETVRSGAWPVIYVKTVTVWATVIEIAPTQRPAEAVPE